MISHASIVMVRCPATGRELSTGVEMDAATFKQLAEIRSRIKCPVCGLDHDWSTREAWLGNPAHVCATQVGSTFAPVWLRRSASSSSDSLFRLSSLMLRLPQV